MIVRNRFINSYRDTVSECCRIAHQYQSDLSYYDRLHIDELYRVIRDMSYINDPNAVEVQVRPGLSLRADWEGPRDCDDKAIVIAAGAIRRSIPFRYAVVGEGDHPHHIYTELFIAGRWVAFDATYPDRNQINRRLYNERFREVYQCQNG